ncbi:hypothetical protein FNV64_52695 [Streptomyces sp. S1A1-7]|uniref:hypothetical protein n=1 Tax=Streptomyces sp. S1A1-7 TaxID=2594459 RepID=UPI00116466EA|nr:hypothetical protein [Streptomyces sp. S1A1-7]QDN82998.1 hypothetical protein FNV64_52695 [Streptomyces sp. S1A1-7]
MPRFTDRTVIITGAAGALGVGTVRRFAAADARVVIGARQREQVTDLPSSTPPVKRTGPLPCHR